MDWPQMQRRCQTARFVCVARLPDYRFAIARHSRLRHCGTANIFLETGCEVWGVVYDVCDRDLATLDGFEDGYRRDKVFVYDRNDPSTRAPALAGDSRSGFRPTGVVEGATSLPVGLHGNRPIETLVYIAPREVGVPLPNAEYKQLLLAGARHWRLPPDYCAMLERIEIAIP